MNFSNILSEIERLDPEVYERTSQRRDVLKSWGRKIALTSLPFALGSMFKKAYGRGTDMITDVLQFALTLEYLEAAFYNACSANDYAGYGPGTVSGGDKTALETIRSHENLHVTFLQNTLTSLGTTPNPSPVFDLSGGQVTSPGSTNSGPFAMATSNYALFLAVAQTLEDTGVRAYKGQAPNLMSQNDILTAALNIHSVEARHAAHIREMRANLGYANVKPWITNAESGVTPASLVAANYMGEDNTTQASVDISMIVGVGGTIGSAAASESFDEPLTKDQVLPLVAPFIKA